MPNLARADIVDILHELYIADGQLSDMIMRNNPTLALLPKKRAGGRYRVIPVKYTRPQGRSATFSEAQAGKTPSKWEAFQVTHSNDFGVAGIDGDAIDDNGDDPEALVNLVRDEMDGVIENLSDSIGHKIFRNTGAHRGRVGSSTGSTITLLNPEDVIHFEIGQSIVFSDNDGSAAAHALRDSGDELVITAINRSTGVLTFAEAVSTISGLANNDYMFVEGDFKLGVAGFEAWAPETAPSSGDSFFGVDRSVDTRLHGLRYDASADPIEEGLQNAAARARRFKSRIKMGVVNPVRWNELSLALGNKKEYTQLPGQGKEAAHLGFEAILVATPAGRIPIVEDPSCPPNVGWFIDPDLWCIDHIGDSLVRLVTEDGNDMLREATSDAYEFRCKARFRMYTMDPSKIMRVKFA